MITEGAIVINDNWGKLNAIGHFRELHYGILITVEKPARLVIRLLYLDLFRQIQPIYK